jgi:hypothetical protein
MVLHPVEEFLLIVFTVVNVASSRSGLNTTNKKKMQGNVSFFNKIK